MSQERKIIDQLRCVMYGDSKDFLYEIEKLGDLLEEYDGVPYDPGSNHLTRITAALRNNSSLWNDINIKVS